MKEKCLFPVLLLLCLLACKSDEDIPAGTDFKQEMRNFVIGISQYAKGINSNFSIIPQNGIELITENGAEDGSLANAYLQAIDGHGQEDLFFGYNKDDKATPNNENIYLRSFLDRSNASGNTILVTDYCFTLDNINSSYYKNQLADYISFAADHRELNNIPISPTPIFSENDKAINSLSAIENFLYLINPGNFSTKAAFINAVTATNYDLLIMDLFFNDDSEFTAAEIDQLKVKANGGSRLVIAYMSIGEAEDYRYYWQSNWNQNKPNWMDKENPNWKGNFKVKYWDSEWQDIIYGNEESYLKKIVSANFDGVYLDIIDAFEFYE